MWPAVKLAAKRMPKATGLEMLLKISIITNRGDNPSGAPAGTNILKKEDLKFLKPSIKTPIQILKDIPKVRDIWVVEGKVYRKKPNKFIPNININNADKGRI